MLIEITFANTPTSVPEGKRRASTSSTNQHLSLHSFPVLLYFIYSTFCWQPQSKCVFFVKVLNLVSHKQDQYWPFQSHQTGSASARFRLDIRKNLFPEIGIGIRAGK